MADYIRILSLHKEGGMFLDLDVLTLKPYDGPQFRNFVTFGSAQMRMIANAVVHMDRGHRLTDRIIQLLADEYDPEGYTFNGPEAISAAMSLMCNVTLGRPKSNMCTDVRLLPHRYFHPIGNAFGRIFFQRMDKDRLAPMFLKQLDNSYGVHFYSSLTRHQSVDFAPNSTQMFSILASRHCPQTLQQLARH